jgi:hypothetical protein
MRDLWFRWMDMPDDERVRQLGYEMALLPIRMGGEGFWLTEEISPKAFAASWHKVATTLGPGILGQDNFKIAVAELSGRSDPFASFVKTYEVEIVEPALARQNNVDPAAVADSSILPQVTLEAVRRRIGEANNNITQHLLVQPLHDLRFKWIWEHGDDMHKALLVMAGLPGANACNVAIGSEAGLRIPSHLARIVTRLRLAIPLINRPTVYKGRTLPLHSSVNAILATVKEGGVNIRRHDFITRFIQVCMRMSALVFRVEDCHLLDQARIDIAWQQIGSSRFTLGDVCIPTPFANSYIAEAVKKAGAVAYKKAAGKRLKYEEKARALGMNFTPLVWEPFGGMIPETLQFVRTLAGQMDLMEAYEPANWAARTRTHYLVQRIAVSLSLNTASICWKALQQVDHPALAAPYMVLVDQEPTDAPLPAAFRGRARGRGRGSGSLAGRGRARGQSPRGSR